MVHALHRAHRMVKPAGLVVEIHPTPETAVILVDDARAGWVDSAGGSARHQAAEDALALALRDGLYRRDDATEFDFDTYGDCIEELRDFILANWRDTAIAADTIARARSLSGGGRRPRVRERVSISRLAPLSE